MRIDEATFKAMPPELQALFVKLPNPGSDEVVGLFPETGVSRGGNSRQINAGTGRYGWNTGSEKAAPDGVDPGFGDTGSAARFFYSAPCLNDLCSYLIKLVTPLSGTILTDCDTATLLGNYNYVTKF